MRRYLMIFMSVAMLFVFTACGNTNKSAQDSGYESATKGQTSEKSDLTSEEKQKIQAKSKSIVVYFSATGTTKSVAQTLADELGTDAYEIIPENQYSSDDLNYNNDNCRANLEMKDDSARPSIKNDLSAVSEYDTVYLGYPIWWGTAPRIIQTFMESYDLSGKTIYTFCTSGSSGVEQSVSDLQGDYPNLNIISGHRFESGSTNETIAEWLKGLK